MNRDKFRRLVWLIVDSKLYIGWIISDYIDWLWSTSVAHPPAGAVMGANLIAEAVVTTTVSVQCVSLNERNY